MSKAFLNADIKGIISPPAPQPLGCAAVHVLFILCHDHSSKNDSAPTKYISIPRHIRKRLLTKMRVATHGLRNTQRI